MSDQITNIIRTFVAAIAGSVGAYFVGHGLDLDSATLNALFYPLCIAVYQAIAVYSAKRWPNLVTLHLLVLPKQPVYVPPTPTVSEFGIHEVTVDTIAVVETQPASAMPKTNWIQQPPWGRR